jgi:aspartyl-tRNA(Asn)/glutamyl-tRNA(Gln) amidotransferase subunit A
VPAGFTGDGLPVGLQIVGPLFGDHLVLRAARAFERAFAIERWPDLARSPAPLRSIGA